VDVWDEINAFRDVASVTPARLATIEGRVVMLQSGIKASHGKCRVYGGTS